MFSALKATFLKDLKINASYRFNILSTFLASFLTIIILYYFSDFIETRFGSNDVDIFSYTLLGIIFISGVTECYQAPVNFLKQAQNQGYILYLNNTKTDFSLIIAFSMALPFVRSLLKIFLVIIVVQVIFNYEVTTTFYVQALIIYFISTIAYLGLSYISSSMILFFKRGDFFSPVLLSLSFICAGILYPVSQLPIYLQAISNLLPLTILLEIIRNLFDGAFLIDQYDRVLYLLFLTSIYLYIGKKIFSASVYYAKKRGNLGNY